MVKKQVSCLALVCLVLLASACSTRPLTLNPRLKAPDIATQQVIGTLNMVPFVDNTPADERGPKKFQEEPIEVLNDALLNTLRLSQSFKSVNKTASAGTADFQLSGKLVSLKTDESWFKFGLIPSTMDVTAICTTNFRLTNTKTGKVLADETITTNGLGGVRVYGGGRNSQYDSTTGYEESMSQAISQNVTQMAKRLIEISSRTRVSSQ